MIGRSGRVAWIFCAALLLGVLIGWLLIDATRPTNDPEPAGFDAQNATAVGAADDGAASGSASQERLADARIPPNPTASDPDAASAAPFGETAFVGVVTDVFGAPLAQCRVTCEPPARSVDLREHARGSGSATRRTDRDGSFTIRIPDSWGEVVLLLDHPDFPPVVACRRRLRATDRGQRIDLGALQLASDTGITVRVRRASDGAAVPGARVTLTPTIIDATTPFSVRDARRAAVVSDGLGLATLRGLPSGAYRLKVDADGFVLREQPLAHGSDAAARSRTIQVSLQRGHVLRGRIVSADGQPIAGAQLRIHPDSGEAAGGVLGPPIEATSSSSGDFRVTRLPAGRRHLVLVDTVEHGSASRAGVEVPQTASGLQIVMPPRQNLQGTVLLADPRDAAPPTGTSGALVTLRPAATPNAPPRVAMSVAPDGSFKFVEIPVGRYILDATSDGATSGPVEVSVPGDAVRVIIRSPRLVRGRIVDSSDGGRRGVPEVRIIPMPAQLATILLANPDDLGGLASSAALGEVAGLDLRPLDGDQPRPVLSDEKGQFELLLPRRSIAAAGSAALWIVAPGRQPSVHRFDLGQTQSADGTLELGPIAVQSDARLRGIVMFSDGTSAVGRTALLLVETPNGLVQVAESRIDQAGRVAFDPAGQTGPFVLQVGSASVKLGPRPELDAQPEPFEVTITNR